MVRAGRKTWRLGTTWWARELALPVALVSVAVSVRLALDPLILGQEVPFLLLLGAVMGSAFLGGLRGGMLSIVLSGIAAAWFLEPRTSLAVEGLSRQVQLASFVAEGAFILTLSVQLRRARDLAEKHADEAADLQRQVSDAADREQRRIGQDLHDDLGQYLTGVALGAQLLVRKMEREGSPHVEATRELVHRMNDAVNRTRQLARGLSPMAVDPRSLPLMLSELQERTVELTARDVSFELIGDAPELPESTVIHLYRIAQEAVSNAIKHSRGSRVDVRLENDDGRVVLEICDDGTGLPVKPLHATPHPKPDAKAGMGLRVMEFRANVIGAQFRIARRDDGPGTLVRVELHTPLEQEFGEDSSGARQQDFKRGEGAS